MYTRKGLLDGLEMKISRDDEERPVKECGSSCDESKNKMQRSICTMDPQRNSRAATLRLSDILNSVQLPVRTMPSQVSYADKWSKWNKGGQLAVVRLVEDKNRLVRFIRTRVICSCVNPLTEI